MFPVRRGLATSTLSLVASVSVVAGLEAWALLDFPAFHACCALPGVPPGTGPARFAFVAYATSAYVYALAMTWTGYLAERSEVMARQLALLAIGTSVVAITRTALALEDTQLPLGISGFGVGALRLTLLVLAFGAVSFLLLRRVSEEKRLDLSRAITVTGLLLGVVALFWIGNLFLGFFPDDAPELSVLGDWSYSVRWIVFGLLITLGFVRLGAFDADANLLAPVLYVSLAVATALLVVFASLLGGPLAAGVVAIAAVLGSIRLRTRFLPPDRSAPLPSPENPSEAPQVRSEAGETRTGGLIAQPRALHGLIGGRYRLGPLLGSGGTGRVYRALDERNGRPVAVKWLARAEAGRAESDLLERELRVAKRTTNRNLVAIHALVRDREGLYLVEELVAGGDLGRSLKQGRASDPGFAKRTCLGILQGLAALHEAGIAHGDLKPSNVLLDPEGQVRLADFGIARFHARERRDGTDSPPGTLSYMAPEQMEGAATSVLTDIYSAGALLFEVLEGRHYLGRNTQDSKRVVQALRRANGCPAAQSIPPQVRRILHRALSRDPDARYEDARRLLDAWKEAQEM